MTNINKLLTITLLTFCASAGGLFSKPATAAPAPDDTFVLVGAGPGEPGEIMPEPREISMPVISITIEPGAGTLTAPVVTIPATTDDMIGELDGKKPSTLPEVLAKKASHGALIDFADAARVFAPPAPQAANANHIVPTAPTQQITIHAYTVHPDPNNPDNPNLAGMLPLPAGTLPDTTDPDRIPTFDVNGATIEVLVPAQTQQAVPAQTQQPTAPSASRRTCVIS